MKFILDENGNLKVITESEEDEKQLTNTLNEIYDNKEKTEKE